MISYWKSADPVAPAAGAKHNHRGRAAGRPDGWGGSGGSGQKRPNLRGPEGGNTFTLKRLESVSALLRVKD